MSDEYTVNAETEISEDDIDKIMENIEKVEQVVEQKAPTPIKAERAAPSLASSSLGVVKNEPANAPVGAPRQTLALELNGTINLKLSFRSGERSIEVFCTDDALICRMADGTEFRVPIGSAAESTKRKSA